MPERPDHGDYDKFVHRLEKQTSGREEHRDSGLEARSLGEKSVPNLL
jgi:hypothetical protein